MSQSAVLVSEEELFLPTYPEPEAESYPMFAENRVHQRSSGNPYPNRVVQDVVRTHREARAYRLIRLENEYLRVELLPELGGRIYSAYDKVGQYDFFYKQHVIKPALIGMLGSWISGGCEFNWPCHHRPSTFMPVDFSVERAADGSVTVWMSEHEPLDRMKGMVGVRLAPDSCVLETKMRVYNRTPLRKSFLWWENAAVPVNEHYRLFFPPDVGYVQFHYRKDVTTFPIAAGRFNGLDLGEGTDIRWHKNTRQPTSYFCAASKYDFFGGYDESRQRGVVHVASRHTAPGKKMFTWAYNRLSACWERALTDSDGPYAELMAGSYSNNQPDFAWLMPYEVKTFRQCWYPIGKMSAPLCATEAAAFSAGDGGAYVQSTRAQTLRVTLNGKDVACRPFSPGVPLFFPFDGEIRAARITDGAGRALLAYERSVPDPIALPDTLPDNPPLSALKSAQECVLAGVHVEQYRDPAARASRYYEEALKKAPDDWQAHLHLARALYANARFPEALTHAQAAWRTLSERNFHPESGEPQYMLGLIWEALGDLPAAYDAYAQAAWCEDAVSRAMTRLAALDGRASDWPNMAEHAEAAWHANRRNAYAVALHALALAHLGRSADALAEAEAALREDPLDHLLRYLRGRWREETPSERARFYESLHSDPAQTALDLAFDLADAGERDLAADLLRELPAHTAMTEYVLGYLTDDASAYDRAAALPFGRAFPSRTGEYFALEAARRARPTDAKARDALGCLLYAKGQYARAATLWREGLALAPDSLALRRNLAVACYSHGNARREARTLLEEALAKSPCDSQILFECLHVTLRLGAETAKIESALAARPPEALRADALLEWARLNNLTGRHERALALLTSRRFTACEGGEHAILEQFMFAHFALGAKAFAQSDYEAARRHFEAAQTPPESLGAGLWNRVLLIPHRYAEAVCLNRLGDVEKARACFRDIAAQCEDYFTNMHLKELKCWQALSLLALGRDAEARKLLSAHRARFEQSLAVRDAGYYKTTPFFISYMESPEAERRADCLYQLGFARLCAGQTAAAGEAIAESLRLAPVNLYARALEWQLQTPPAQRLLCGLARE